MRLTGAQRAADLHQECGRMVFYKGVLPLLRRPFGILILQLLRGNKSNVPLRGRQDIQRREQCAHGFFRVTDRSHDALHCLLQMLQRTLLRRNHFFPVPLIHINGVEIVEIFIPPDGVHIRDNSAAHIKTIAVQRRAFPFGQRMHHLSMGAGGPNIKFHRRSTPLRSSLSPVAASSSSGADTRRKCSAPLRVSSNTRLVMAMATWYHKAPATAGIFPE